MIFIAGATGFVGMHLIKSLKKEGHNIRCLVRSDKKTETCKSLGFETFKGDITDRESLRGSLEGVKTVVHLVGIIQEKEGLTFKDVHVEGTTNLIEEAQESGIEHFFYQSALGASLQSPFKYSKTKAEAEEIVKDSNIPYTIFRPSLIIGSGDNFTENIKVILRLGPIVPVPGNGESKLQPIFILDWIRCFLKALDNPGAINRVFEIGGPEHLSYNEILNIMIKASGINKPVMHIPATLVKVGLPFTLTFGSIGKVIGMNLPDVSSEQIDLLQVDNITDVDSIKKLFGFEPVRFGEAIKKVMTGYSDDR